MASDGYVTIHRTTDAAQGELLAEMLRREGIDARFHKVSAALIGMPAGMFEMTVEVPAAAEARARQLIADLEYTGAAEALERGEQAPGEAERAGEDEDGDEDEEEDGQDGGAAPAGGRGPGLSNRRPIFAAGFAVFVPGAGHLYARRAWTALVMASGAVGCLWMAATSRNVTTFNSACAALFAIVVCDAIGGVRAARAEGWGEHASRGRQLVRGLCLLGVAIGLGGGAEIASAVPSLLRQRAIEKYVVSCSDRSIVIENRGGDAHAVEIADLKVEAASFFGTQIYDVGISGPMFLTLPRGGRGAVTTDVAGWLARACKFPSAPGRIKIGGFFVDPPEDFDMVGPQPTSCRFSFAFVARDEESRGEAFRTIGRCVPPLSPGTMAAGALEMR